MQTQDAVVTQDNSIRKVPRTYLTSDGDIKTDWIIPIISAEKDSIIKGIESLKNKWDYNLANDVCHAISELFDKELILGNDVTPLIEISFSNKITCYLGNQIFNYLNANPKQISNPKWTDYFKKHREACLSFNKEKKIVTTIEERFV